MVTLEGVYPPSEDTYLLIDAVAQWAGGTVLELCSGTGAVGASLAQRGSRVVAVDINPVAVRNTLINCRNLGVADRVDALVGDLFAPLRGDVFDLVVMNPPYVDDGGVAGDSAWSGGKRGREIIDRFIVGVGGFLREGGRGVFIQTDLNGFEETVKGAEAADMVARVLAERVFRFETLLAVEVRRHSAGRKTKIL